MSAPPGDALRRMLEARSVAVIGASAREGSVGRQTLVELLEGGFDGEVYPVNPRYDEVLGLRCYPTIAEVGRAVDLAIVAVGNAGLEDALRGAAEAGAASAVIFASAHEEPREGVPPLTERLARIAREHGMAVCGANCMGFANLERRLRACGFYEPKDLEPGPIAFVSHSGSAFSAMLHNRRGLRFNLAVSAGQELVTTAADYLRYALSLDSTRAVALFLETVRDPAGFREALRRAEERDVPVVALKVGREPLTKELVLAHSGALAGEDGAYEALFEAHGVLRVSSLDEMADTLALLVAGRRAAPGGLASVHDSGGERALLIDTAAEVGVPLARVSPRTSARLAELLDPGLPPVNPLDFWGTGRDVHEVVTGCLRALLDDPAVGALAFCVDLTTEDRPEAGYIRMAEEVYPGTAKPMAMLANLSSGIDRGDVERLYRAGIPVLEGTRTGLLAFRHLFELRDHRALPPLARPEPAPAEVRERWAERLQRGEPLGEVEGLALLADHGVPAVPARTASSAEEAVEAARALGFPVACKTAAPGVLHKSEADGVRLGLRDEREVAAAYADLARRLGPRVTVARMAPSGVELHLGIVRDPQFGPLVMVAAGGVLVEVLGDRRLALPPLDAPRARRLVEGLRVRPLLEGVRGRPPADVEALVRALVRLSALAADLGDLIDALDANPVICGPEGCLAVDALVIPR
ncbi:MAG TPA: acetate--CoA ligase family protein, partial [Actinomycetota bacterium]|nr:acetate--CoA ligase family protein [Actinomycetota bacterium]